MSQNIKLKEKNSVQFGKCGLGKFYGIRLLRYVKWMNLKNISLKTAKTL